MIDWIHLTPIRDPTSVELRQMDQAECEEQSFVVEANPLAIQTQEPPEHRIPDQASQGEHCDDIGPEDELMEPIDVPEGYPKLDARPPMLEKWVLITIITFNTASLAGMIALLVKAGKDNQYTTSYRDIRYVIRYAPALIGTMTQLAYRSVFDSYARLEPYIAMADSKKDLPAWKKDARRTIAIPYIPPASLMLEAFRSRRWLRFTLRICLGLTGFITGFKSGLSSSTATPTGYIVTVYPNLTFVLIGIYTLNICATIWILLSLWSCTTGLKWDPVTIADQVALFHNSNILREFQQLEAHPTKWSWQILGSRTYRIGYWLKGKGQNKSIVCCIGRESVPRVTTSQRRRIIKFEERLLETRAPRTNTSHSAHAPKHTSPKDTLIGTTPFILLGSSFFGGLFIKNNWHTSQVHHNQTDSIPESFNVTSDPSQPLVFIGGGPSSAAKELVVYILTFRTLPVSLASIFAIGIMGAVDAGHRFSQPFANMFNKHASAEDTILLNYLWGIPVAVTVEALKKKHWKVAWFSLLALLNPFFPILVSGLFTITNTGPRIIFKVDNVAFYLVFAYLVVYTLSLPFAWPRWNRRLPRNCYSIADILSLCYASSMVRNPAMDISGENVTQRHLESRIFLQEETYSVGMSTGIDGNVHFGIDVVHMKDAAGNSRQHVFHVSKSTWEQDISQQ
ncbi:hypothetical protein P154DRAFT_533441 [Amniculicola lignicola CBS 123094]|uniref:Uncharacterized protein n=1 Tax=Amniculicola lignicola CBS 123094 TaxID=1392246 RepID=A0A6A5WW43_9PLEO|nr:hypothetical protein P154DRAFT_533441 [Amniculicola lignicola CBS 123094]